MSLLLLVLLLAERKSLINMYVYTHVLVRLSPTEAVTLGCLRCLALKVKQEARSPAMFQGKAPLG